MTRPNKLLFFPIVCLALLLLPILFGLVSTWLPAFGFLPVIGAHDISLQHFENLFQHPSVSSALTSTLFSGLGATIFSFLLSLGLAMYLHQSNAWHLVQKNLSPLLAMPHAAFAIGFGFLISPSGWILRGLSPGITGFESPPDWIILKDPMGFSLMLTLILKETPFLVLMMLSALNQIDSRRSLWVGTSLGYDRIQTWRRVLIPQLIPKLRLPVMAVLTYSLSVVDLAIIIGPSAPGTLAVMINRWFNDPDTSFRLMGAAGASLLLVIIIIAILCQLVLERFYLNLNLTKSVAGKRSSLLNNLGWMARLFARLMLTTTLLTLAVLVLWSVAQVWRFPDFFPRQFSLNHWWNSLDRIQSLSFNSLSIGIASSFIALIIVVGSLEFERLQKRLGKPVNQGRVLLINYLPLLVPQIAFIFGVQVMFIMMRFEGNWWAILWSHFIFVLPYVFLTLSSVYRDYDERYFQVALTLSASPWLSFIKIKLPMLIRPILYSFAIGCSVSFALYLPTIYIGAGRMSTITTETVSLASGSDRRVIAVFALWQLLLPLIIFTLAILIPNRLFKNRIAMS